MRKGTEMEEGETETEIAIGRIIHVGKKRGRRETEIGGIGIEVSEEGNSGSGNENENENGSENVKFANARETETSTATATYMILGTASVITPTPTQCPTLGARRCTPPRPPVRHGWRRRT
jgi:hypothetical protein